LSDIPEEIMQRARDALLAGYEYKTLEQMDRQARSVALALIAERDRALKEAAKVAKALDEGGCECGGYACYCGNYGDASSAASAATAALIAKQIIGMMRSK
jgi:hypothetical protein